MDSSYERLPIGEDEQTDRHPEVVPEVLLAPELSSALLIEPIGEFEYLMHEEGKHVEKKEVEREMLCPMAVVVLYVVAMVLHRIEDFVLYLPSRPAYS